MAPIIVLLDSSDEDTDKTDFVKKKSKISGIPSGKASPKNGKLSKTKQTELITKCLEKSSVEKSELGAGRAPVVARQSPSSKLQSEKPKTVAEIPKKTVVIDSKSLCTKLPNPAITESPDCSELKITSVSSLENDLKRKIATISKKKDETLVKRIKPTQISDKVDQSWVASQSPLIATDDDENIVGMQKHNTSTRDSNPENISISAQSPSSTETTGGASETELPVNATFTALLAACRDADPSDDMERVIKDKLLKYYHSVHPDFVESRGFTKTVKSVTAEIIKSPELVYYQVKIVVEELKIRKKSKNAVMSNENVISTGSKKKDGQIIRLDAALLRINRRIKKLERAEVDLEDANSSYLKVEHEKKKACKIYEMICDLTGESKNARRVVKKPIIFRETVFPEFDKTLQDFVNRSNCFPDFFDVYKCLEHCNSMYHFGLRNDDINRIAHDAFIKLGKLLQSRRKTDLYETVAYFTCGTDDPAESDPNLRAKLAENQKNQTKISSIIDRFASEQECVTLGREINKDKHLMTNKTDEDDVISIDASLTPKEKYNGCSNEINKNSQHCKSAAESGSTSDDNTTGKNERSFRVNDKAQSKETKTNSMTEEIIILDDEDL